MTIFNFLPVGSILPTGEATPPAGWLLCDGSAVSRSVYANLFQALGTSWGAGDGSTTFHLPDLRGRFLRGRDGGVGRDPDRTTRTASNPGGNTGDAVGTVQGHGYKTHNHGVTASGGTTGGESADHYHDTGWVSSGHTHWLAGAGDHYHYMDDAYYAEANGGNQGIRGEGYGSDWDNAPFYRWITTSWAGWHGHWRDGINTNHYHGTGGRDAGHSHAVTSSATVNSNGGNETRSKNVTLNYIIKI